MDLKKAERLADLWAKAMALDNIIQRGARTLSIAERADLLRARSEVLQEFGRLLKREHE